jgi:hypothetical protein
VAGRGEAPWDVAGRGGVVDDDAEDSPCRQRLECETGLEECVGAHLPAEIQIFGRPCGGGGGPSGGGLSRYLSTGSVGVFAHSIHEPS